MRTKQADGSITEDCAKCQGAGHRRNVEPESPNFARHERCAECGGVGQKVIAPVGHKVTDESPEVKVVSRPYGGGQLNGLETVGMEGPIVDGKHTHKSDGGPIDDAPAIEEVAR